MSAARTRIRAVSEPFTVRQQPRTSSPTLADLKLLVRTPGNPSGYKSFTEAQRADAEAYAEKLGVTVTELS